MLYYILSLYLIIVSKHNGDALTKNCKTIGCLDVDCCIWLRTGTTGELLRTSH